IPSRRSPARARSTRASATGTTSRWTSAARGQRLRHLASRPAWASARKSEHERRAVAAQPLAVLAIARPASLQQLPEGPRMVEDLQVADLVPDDVVEHPLGPEQQSPVEAHAPVRRARRPARALRADRHAAVAGAGEAGRPLYARLDLRAGGPSVEALPRPAGGAPRDEQAPAPAGDARGAPPRDGARRAPAGGGGGRR